MHSLEFTVLTYSRLKTNATASLVFGSVLEDFLHVGLLASAFSFLSTAILASSLLLGSDSGDFFRAGLPPSAISFLSIAILASSFVPGSDSRDFLCAGLPSSALLWLDAGDFLYTGLPSSALSLLAMAILASSLLLGSDSGDFLRAGLPSSAFPLFACRARLLYVAWPAACWLVALLLPQNQSAWKISAREDQEKKSRSGVSRMLAVPGKWKVCSRLTPSCACRAECF